MNNLAEAYRGRIRGERAENIELAIYYLKQAQQIWTRQAFPEDWALSCNNLALAYWGRIRGERAENIELAIEFLQQAQKVWTRKAAPLQWAQSCNNLATTYEGRIRGERAENIELTIEFLEQALEVCTRPAFPTNWATSCNNLANAYRQRIRGERAQNIELAIEFLQQTLEVYTRQAFPYEWARSMNNLAEAYRERIRGERAKNIELAISFYEQSLEVYTPQAFPYEWASSMNNLALALYNRIRGERAENIELAISFYEQAQQVWTRQAFPKDWALSCNNLAAAYKGRIRGERAKNIELAISFYERAQQVWTRQAAPLQWATSRNNRAYAYAHRIRGERAENIELAISFYEQALQVVTRRAFPEKWARSINNLAGAYDDRIRGERAENIELAISFYEQAQQVWTRQAFPEDWAMSMHNLAYTYAQRIKGGRVENIELAIECLQQALEVMKPQSLPQNCRDTAYSLGGLLYREGRFAEARQAFVTAHEAVEALRGEVVREAAKRELAEENANLYARLVYCCLHEGDEVAAFKYAAAGKGRAFADLLATAHFDLSAAAANDPAFAADWEKYRELGEQIDNLQAQLMSNRGIAVDDQGSEGAKGVSKKVLRAELSALREQKAAHWEDMTYEYPALTATQSAPSLSVQQACDLSADLGATLVEYYRHAKGWCAFVVTPEQMHYVPLLQMDDQRLLEEANDWLKAIQNPRGRNKLSYLFLHEVHQVLIAPLQQHLPMGQAVVLAPFSWLHLLPLGAACSKGNYINQVYDLALAPSLSALRMAWQEARQSSWQKAERLLSVAYPGTPHLPNVLPEAKAIAGLFGQTTPLYEADATPKAVLAHARKQEIIHFGCHGHFDPQQPSESGLMLAHSSQPVTESEPKRHAWLTVQAIITELQLEQTRLATLGACFSGWAEVKAGDNFMGLMQAMLTAGAQTVAAGLWAVNDASTRLLFVAFYHQMRKGVSPAKAMQAATKLLQDSPTLKPPYYWAAFGVNGLAHLSATPLTPWPEDLLKEITTIAQSPNRGVSQMNATTIIEGAEILLKQMKRYQSMILSDLDAIEYTVVVDTLSELGQRMSTAQNEAEVLAVANMIHTLTEEVAGLREWLVPEHTNTQLAQADRLFTQEDHQATEVGNQKAVGEFAPRISNEIVIVRDEMKQKLPSLDEQQAQEVARRKRELKRHTYVAQK